MRKRGEHQVFSGTMSPGSDVPITLARHVGGRLVGVLGGRTNGGGYSLSVPLAPGRYAFQVVTATATSRVAHLTMR